MIGDPGMPGHDDIGLDEVRRALSHDLRMALEGWAKWNWARRPCFFALRAEAGPLAVPGFPARLGLLAPL
jgi:hypothetical protein